MALDDELKDLDPREQEQVKAFLQRILNEKRTESESIVKHGESIGIKWDRKRSLDYGNDKSSVDFNTFFTNQVKEYKNELLLNSPEQRSKEPKPAQHMLVERHNLERLTTRYSYYPTDGQFVEVESYMAQ